MKAKIIMLSALGIASFGLTQAANATWAGGDCSSTTDRPCIEYNGTNHFTSTGGSSWHGIPGTTNPFVFSGPTNLVCNGIPVDCDLTLEGKVNIDGSPERIGIQVENFSVSGGLICSSVTVSGFNWYVAPNNYHGPYSAGSPGLGLPYSSPMTLIGSIGPIGVSVPLITNFTGGHMHDVTYNNSDTFSFGTGSLDPVIYLNGSAHDDSGCRVSGDLQLQSPGTSLTIY